MVNIEYKRTKGQIIVKVGKKAETYSARPETVNEQALCFIKRHFVEVIKKLCNERINAMNHSVYREDLDGKKEFFMKLLAGIDYAIKQPTWKSYLSTCLVKLRDYAPRKTSRYYQNYIWRVEDLKMVFDKYSNAELYYEVGVEQIVLDLFDTQHVTDDYLS